MNASIANVSYDVRDSAFFHFITYQPLFIIAMGLLGNTLSFFIFRFNDEFKTMSSMVYLSIVAITDTLSLFEWNLDHYLIYNWFISTSTINVPVCKISKFTQYFSLQTSALLLSIMSVDRYVQVASMPGSRLSKLPFRTVKSAYIWCAIIITTIALLNFHILVLACTLLDSTEYPATNDPKVKLARLSKRVKSVQVYENGFRLFPVWESVHIIIYSAIPSVIMLLANGLILKNIFVMERKKHYAAGGGGGGGGKESSSRKKMTNVLSLVLVALLFLLMTFPNTILQTFFSDRLTIDILYFSDHISFLNHAIIFFLCFVTNRKFRNIVVLNVKKSSKKLTDLF